MKAYIAASLTTLGASLATAATAVAFSQASSNKTSRVALGVFTFLAVSFSAASLIGLSAVILGGEEEKDIELGAHLNGTLKCLPIGAALTAFSLSALTVLHVFRRAFRSMNK